jgi:hypothetical protein
MVAVYYGLVFFLTAKRHRFNSETENADMVELRMNQLPAPRFPFPVASQGQHLILSAIRVAAYKTGYVKGAQLSLVS